MLASDAVAYTLFTARARSNSVTSLCMCSACSQLIHTKFGSEKEWTGRDVCSTTASDMCIHILYFFWFEVGVELCCGEVGEGSGVLGVLWVVVCG